MDGLCHFLDDISRTNSAGKKVITDGISKIEKRSLKLTLFFN